VADQNSQGNIGFDLVVSLALEVVLPQSLKQFVLGGFVPENPLDRFFGKRYIIHVTLFRV
jgi:hypothetical protein